MIRVYGVGGNPEAESTLQRQRGLVLSNVVVTTDFVAKRSAATRYYLPIRTLGGRRRAHRELALGENCVSIARAEIKHDYCYLMKPIEARTGKTDWDMVGIVEADLEQCSQDNTQAFEALFREYQGEVYGWIIRILRDSGAAEDLSVPVILMLAGFVVLRFGYNVPIPMERFLVFPLAIVPGLWGLRNVLRVVVRKAKEDSN